MEQNTGAKHASRNRPNILWAGFGCGALSGILKPAGNGFAFKEGASLEQGHSPGSFFLLRRVLAVCMFVCMSYLLIKSGNMKAMA